MDGTCSYLLSKGFAWVECIVDMYIYLKKIVICTLKELDLKEYRAMCNQEETDVDELCCSCSS